MSELVEATIKFISPRELIEKVRSQKLPPLRSFTRANIQFNIIGGNESDFTSSGESAPQKYLAPDNSLLSCIESIIRAYDIEEVRDENYLGERMTTLAKMAVFGMSLVDPDRGVQKQDLFPLMCSTYTNNYCGAIGIIPAMFPHCVLLVRGKSDSKQFTYFALRFERIFQWLSENKSNMSGCCLNADFGYGKLCFNMSLGNGQGGAVYALDANKVVKIIDFYYGGANILDAEDESDMEKLAFREALIMYRLKDLGVRNVPVILDYGYVNGIYFYIIMTKLPERKSGNKNYEQCQAVFNDLSSVAGVVHGDLHSENVILTSEKCYLLDFGRAQVKSAFSSSAPDESTFGVNALREYDSEYGDSPNSASGTHKKRAPPSRRKYQRSRCSFDVNKQSKLKDKMKNKPKNKPKKK